MSRERNTMVNLNMTFKYQRKVREKKNCIVIKIAKFVENAFAAIEIRT